jgi:hypothetical protein
MAAPLLYNVITEFRFEIGSALLGSEKLSSAVQDISTAADGALHSFQRLGAGIVASMGIGTGGLLGALGLALQVSDKFAQSQRDIANIITSNAGGTMTWADALAVADSTMSNINKKAQEFSLSTSDLLSTSKQLGAVLLSHGLDDVTMSKSVDLSRQYLKSAPTLGVDPGMAQQQLVRAVLGDASGNDTLFTRLTGETKALKPFGESGGTQKFNALPAAQRLDLLTKGLAQFSSNVNYTHGNALSLSGEMRRLSENIKGTFSIIKGVGDALIVPVKMALHGLNNYLQTSGKAIFDSFGKIIASSFEKPETALATFYQASRLAADVKLASTILGVVGGFIAMNHVLGMLGISIPIVTIALRALAVAVGVGTVGAGLLMALFVKMFAAITAILVPLALLVGFIQLISRAIAYAKINDAKALAELAPRFAEVMRLFKFIFQPFFDAFDAVAEFISPLFQVSLYARMAASALEFMATTLLLARATFQGIVFAIMELFNQLQKFFSGGGFSFAAIGDAFNAGIDQLLEEALGKVSTGESTVTQVTNIGKVEIKNQFKEQMEPDRVAFSLTKQLMKAAQNPTQSRGRQFAPAGSPT